MTAISISQSALRVIQARTDVTANNVANATTQGFRASRLDAATQPGGGARIGATPRSDLGGTLAITGHDLDLAVSGQGFFVVETPQGQQFTRAGAFHLDADGRLVTPRGGIVQPGLSVPAGTSSISIGADGRALALLDDGTQGDVGTLELATFRNPDGLESTGDGLFSVTASSGTPSVGPPATGGRGSIIQGVQEQSNVDLAREMVDLITSRNQFSSNLRVIRAQDDLLGEVIDLMA